MMNGKAVIPLVAGLCIGGFALKMVFDTVRKAKGAQTPMATVYAAKMDIPLGSRIDDSMLTELKYPAKAIPQGAFTKKDNLVGRVPRTLVVAGLPIVEGALHPPGAPPGLWVKSGYRAIAVRIDDSSGVDNHLYPGCFVDVVGYFNIRKNGKQETIARTLIENVEVAAVGQRLSLADDTTPGEGKKKPQPARAVTLFVKPDQVPALHLAEQRGKIKLSMRAAEAAAASAPSERTKTVAAVTESAIIGEEEEGEKKDNQLGKLGGLFANFFANQPSQAAVQAPVAPAVVAPPVEPPPAPKPAWVTTVHNGEKSREIQWKSRNSREQLPADGSGHGLSSAKRRGARVQTAVETNDVSGTSPAPSAEPEPAGHDGPEFEPVEEPEESPE
jgi:pilus assembly protein CpaB